MYIFISFHIVVNINDIDFSLYNSSIIKKLILIDLCFTFYIYAFSRRFYPMQLTVHSGYTFLVSM